MFTSFTPVILPTFTLPTHPSLQLSSIDQVRHTEEVTGDPGRQFRTLHEPKEIPFLVSTRAIFTRILYCSSFLSYFLPVLLSVIVLLTYPLYFPVHLTQSPVHSGVTSPPLHLLLCLLLLLLTLLDLLLYLPLSQPLSLLTPLYDHFTNPPLLQHHRPHRTPSSSLHSYFHSYSITL